MSVNTYRTILLLQAALMALATGGCIDAPTTITVSAHEGTLSCRDVWLGSMLCTNVSVQWFRDGNLIEGESGQQITPTEEGTYSCQIGDAVSNDRVDLLLPPRNNVQQQYTIRMEETIQLFELGYLTLSKGFTMLVSVNKPGSFSRLYSWTYTQESGFVVEGVQKENSQDDIFSVVDPTLDSFSLAMTLRRSGPQGCSNIALSATIWISDKSYYAETTLSLVSLRCDREQAMSQEFDLELEFRGEKCSSLNIQDIQSKLLTVLTCFSVSDSYLSCKNRELFLMLTFLPSEHANLSAFLTSPQLFSNNVTVVAKDTVPTVSHMKTCVIICVAVVVVLSVLVAVLSCCVCGLCCYLCHRQNNRHTKDLPVNEVEKGRYVEVGQKPKMVHGEAELYDMEEESRSDSAIPEMQSTNSESEPSIKCCCTCHSQALSESCSLPGSLRTGGQ